MSAEGRLEIRGLVKRFGALVATDQVSLAFRPQETHAIIGPNGAGKSTLINLITGDLPADAGQIVLDGEDITALSVARRSLKGLARSFQITELVTGFTALDNVCLAVQGRADLISVFAAGSRRPGAYRACASGPGAGGAVSPRGRAGRDPVAWREAPVGDRHRPRPGAQGAAA